MQPVPLISLAVIARDESASVSKMLASHGGLWDEAIVVDTGSMDDTASAAAEAGARVFPVAWCDDFSAARNEALAQCRGRWILVLDCDESIAPRDVAAVRRLAEDSEPTGFIFPQWNYADDSGLPGWHPRAAAYDVEAAGAAGFVIAHQVRLFPGGGFARYCGRIHETAEKSLIAQGLSLVPVSIPVHHHGHRSGPGEIKARRIRNGRLLRQKLREMPDDPQTRYEMAVQLLDEGHRDLARRLMSRLVAEAPGGPDSSRAHGMLGRLELVDRRFAAACREFETAVRLRPDLCDHWLDLIRAQWAAGECDAAAVWTARARCLFPAEPRLKLLAAQVLASTADQCEG